MERTLSPEERIRRAEEIYYRRKMQNGFTGSTRVNVSSRKEFSLFKKMILQIAICIVIYSIFYMIQNTNYIFSEDVLKKTNEILSYDVNLQKLYEQGRDYINSFINNIEKNENSIINENQGEENNTNNNEIKESNASQEENIGGGTTENADETENLSQMEKDAKEILANKSIILPLKGTITSRFGLRNPETPTVPKNHTGIDIAVNEGTVFIASMEGIVEDVSRERRFRKPY